MSEIELDLTRPALQRPELELDLDKAPHWQQTDVRAEFGEIDMTRPEPSEETQSYADEQEVILKPAPVGMKPARPESAITVRPELVEGQSGSTSSPRTELHTVRPESINPVRPELVEGGTLPSMEEFAVAKLAEQYNYKGQLTIGALEDDIVFRIRRSASDVLEAGKALIILKEAAGHGNFSKRLELLGFKERTARNYMRVAEKFGKSASNAVLVNKVGEYQKILELTFFEDTELETLATGGDVDGIDLEQIKALSAPKLKALIKNRVEVEKKPLEEKVESLNKQIDNHEKAFSKLQAEKETAENKLTALTVKKHPGKDMVSVEVQAVREEAFALEYGIRVYTDALQGLLKKALYDYGNEADQALKINSIAIATSAALANVDSLFQELQGVLGISEMPPALSGRHILTEEERDRLEDSKAMIDHKFNVDKTLREARREEENKRGAGRPAGSLNKPRS